MSDELLQFIVVVGFGALCFGCGCLIAFIVTRNKYRDEMIKRGFARYNQQTGKWEWGEPAKETEDVGSATMIQSAADCGEYCQFFSAEFSI